MSNNTGVAAHINVLELHAILLVLRAFRSWFPPSAHVCVHADNATAVAYVNRMGGSASAACDAVASEIWEFMLSADLWLSAAFIPGVCNTAADFASRHFSHSTEWQLDPACFQELYRAHGPFQVDLFTSYANHQLRPYYSWGPDPYSSVADAFIVSWREVQFYAFPPFGLLL